MLVGEITADMGFKNRCDISGTESMVQPVAPEWGCARTIQPVLCSMHKIKFRLQTIKMAFFIGTGGTCTYLGKPNLLQTPQRLGRCGQQFIENDTQWQWRNLAGDYDFTTG
eukprot:scaffold102958_cov58-Attheya_sp.AAC.2